jgi:hypothetical protein
MVVTSGSPAFSVDTLITRWLFGNIIDICGQRGVSPWTYLAEVICLRRQGCDTLPQCFAHWPRPSGARA